MAVKQRKTIQATFSFEKQTFFNHKDVDFTPYSKFDDKDHFNIETEKIMAVYKGKFKTQKQLRVLATVRRAACTIPGVAMGSYGYYIENYEEFYGETISEDTFRRTIAKAEKLGILIKNFGQRMIEGHGSQTANVIIFNTYNEVKAYKAVQDAKDRAEMEKLLAEQYAKTEKMMNWATEARQIAKKSNENIENTPKMKKNDAEKAPQSNQKPRTMYKTMLDKYKPVNEQQRAQFNELVAVAYAMKKKAVKENNLPEIHLERIILTSFEVLLSKKGVQNQAAMFSAIIKNQIKRVIDGNKPVVKGARVEIVPEFLKEGMERTKREREEKERAAKENAQKGSEGQINAIDFEKERQEMLAKLRANKR